MRQLLVVNGAELRPHRSAMVDAVWWLTKAGKVTMLAPEDSRPFVRGPGRSMLEARIKLNLPR